MEHKWYHYELPKSGDGDITALSRRISGIEGRLAELERIVRVLQAQPLVDSARSAYSWGDGEGERYYHRYADVASAWAQFAPWLSTTARIAGDLTSSDTVRRTFGEALLLGVSFTVLGAGAAWLWELPWFASPVIGVCGFAASAGFLVALNRTELHRLVSAQREKNQKRRQELRVQIDKADYAGRVVGVEFLYVAGITLEQLVEFAPQALRLENLSVNLIGGGGKIFTQGQAQALGAELELLGYASQARGPVGRRLTAKGRAFFKGLAERGK